MHHVQVVEDVGRRREHPGELGRDLAGQRHHRGRVEEDRVGEDLDDPIELHGPLPRVGLHQRFVHRCVVPVVRPKQPVGRRKALPEDPCPAPPALHPPVAVATGRERGLRLGEIIGDGALARRLLIRDAVVGEDIVELRVQHVRPVHRLAGLERDARPRRRDDIGGRLKLRRVGHKSLNTDDEILHLGLDVRP